MEFGVSIFLPSVMDNSLNSNFMVMFFRNSAITQAISPLKSCNLPLNCFN